ncbi:MAG: hypothetical protein JW882_17860 [Deltaproteobacteria bacterium]|nr:hypothetical protein [Deltaproteobacteria bacterium]
MAAQRDLRNNDPANRLIGGFISTKLHMPPLDSKMIEKTNLLNRLSEGRSRPLMEDYVLFVNDRYEYASGRRWLVRGMLLILIFNSISKIRTNR